MDRRLVCAVCVVLLMWVSGPLWGQLTLDNAGFDQQEFDDGGWSAGADVFDWEAGGWSHAQDLAASSITPEAQSGENTCGLNEAVAEGEPVFVQQTVKDGNDVVLVEADQTYDVSVWVGRRADEPGTNGGILEVYLLESATSTKIAQATYDLDAQERNSWTLQSFVLSTGADPIGAGSELRLGLENIGTRSGPDLFWQGQIVLDDVSIGIAAVPVDPGTEGLVAYYPLDGDVNDASGNGLDGIIMGAPNFVEGAAGMALQFDGVDDYVDCGNDAAFDITEQVTLSAWVNTQDIGTGQNNPWVGKGDNSYMLKGHRSGTQIEFFIFNETWVTAHADVGDSFNGQWHHVAGMYDGAQLKIYVDGALAVAEDYVGSIDPSTDNVAIATNSGSGGRFSEGIIDEVMIYGRALSAGEIAYLAGERPAPTPIAVENASFELPGTEKIKGWNGEGVAGTPAVDIPGWASDTEVVDSGVEMGWGATDGVWTAFLMGGDPSVWQLTGHVIGEGELFQLAVDSKDNWLATTLQMTLYYDSEGVRVPAAVQDFTLTDAMTEYTVSVSASDVPEAVGKNLGIEFNNVTEEPGSYLALDRVQLYVSPE